MSSRRTRTSTSEKPASVARRRSSARNLSRRAKLRGDRVTDTSIEYFADGAVVRPDPCPDAERQAAARFEYAAHLPQRDQPVGKKLEPLLAENHVEVGGGQSQINRAALKPFDWCANHRGERLRNGNHSRIEVDAHNPSGRADPLRANARDEAGAAGQVQHALA